MTPELTLSFEVPPVDPQTLAGFLEARFGLLGSLDPLPGERDRNFRLTTDRGLRYVVKVANATEEQRVIELQHAALTRMAERAPSLDLPRVVPARGGATIEHLDLGGRRHLVRVLTWVDGVPLATVDPRTASQFHSLGQLLGQIHQALEGFEHPAAERALKWDLGQAE